MKLQGIKATSNSQGNRIDLSWINPEPDLYPEVRIVRREMTYPLSYDDGHLVAEISAYLFSISIDADKITDLNTSIIPLEVFRLFNSADILLSNKSSLSVITLSKKWLITEGEKKYILKNESEKIEFYKQELTTITDVNLKSETVYYYGLFPYNEDPLEYVIDYSNRATSMATGCYDMAGQLYELLPRIYHRYDTVLSEKVPEADSKKGELRRFLDIPGSQLDYLYSSARALLQIHQVDKIDGALLPLLSQWIGWKTDYRLEIDKQRNEINAAPYLYQTIGLIPNVEAAVKRISGWESRTKEFVHNILLTNSPERLNIWASEKNDADEWSESTEPLSLDYAYEGRPTCASEGSKTWLFYNAVKRRFGNKDNKFREVSNIWYKTFENNQWSPSQPLTDHEGIDKHPSAANHGDTLVVFWSRYNETAKSWFIEYLTRSNGTWLQHQSYDKPFGESPAERRNPLVVTDNENGLWLFWLEKIDSRWQMKYNRHDGANWQSPQKCPVNEIMEDPFVLFYGPNKHIYIFWTQRDRKGRRSVVYTFKKSTNADLSDWNTSEGNLPREQDEDYNDREPAALVRNETIEVYWSSNKKGSYSIWKSIFSPGTNTWEEARQVTTTHYSQRAPLPLNRGNSTIIIYRSNESISHKSKVYKATKTLDFRYAGSLSFDVKNRDKNNLRGLFEDFQTYTFDTGIKDEDWYARDTVGMYITAGTDDPHLINLNRGIFQQLLHEIMPIQVRPAFIMDTAYKEKVFPEGFPLDQFRDVMICFVTDLFKGAKDAYTDMIPEWTWLRTFDSFNNMYLNHKTVDSASVPVDTTYRTWHIGLKEEE